MSEESAECPLEALAANEALEVAVLASDQAEEGKGRALCLPVHGPLHQRQEPVLPASQSPGQRCLRLLGVEGSAQKREEVPCEAGAPLGVIEREHGEERVVSQMDSLTTTPSQGCPIR